MHLPFMDQSMVLLVLALLLFGKRLPEVGRSIGRGIIEFKKGLAGIEEDINNPPGMATPAAARPATPPQYKFDPQTGQPLQPQIASNVPPGAKFDPYTGKPLESESVNTSQTSSV